MFVTCCNSVFRHIHKVFVLKTFHLQAIQLRTFPFPHTVRTCKECHKYQGNDPTFKGNDTSRMMAGEPFGPSLVPGSSKVQVAGSEHAMMAQKCNGIDIYGWVSKSKSKQQPQEINLWINIIIYY